MSRRALTPAVLSTCALLALTGCSGGSSVSSKTAAPTPTATPLTATAAAAQAKAAILTTADLPGYAATKQTHDAGDDANDAKLATCLGVPAPTYLARDSGTSFTKGEVEVDSSADVAKTAAAGKAELAAFTGATAPGCLKDVLSSVVGASGLTVTTFTAEPQTVTVVGSDAAFGYKLAFTGTTQGRTIEFSGFETGALVGQVEVSVSVIASAASRYPLANAVGLLTTAVGRVKTAA